MDKAAATVAGLNNVVRNRYEMRDIDCKRTWNFTTGFVSLVRTDTGEEMDRRPITEAERTSQRTFWEDAKPEETPEEVKEEKDDGSED